MLVHFDVGVSHGSDLLQNTTKARRMVGKEEEERGENGSDDVAKEEGGQGLMVCLVCLWRWPHPL